MPSPEVTADVPVATAQPRGCTNFKLRSLTRQVTQRYDAELSKAGLKGTQFSLLSCVDRLGPIQPSELAHTMSMDASTLTRNLRPLLDAGWLLLGPGQNGRSRLVHITEAGRLKRQEARARWREAQLSLNALLGEPVVVALHALLDDSLLKLEAAAEGQDATPDPDAAPRF